MFLVGGSVGVSALDGVAIDKREAVGPGSLHNVAVGGGPGDGLACGHVDGGEVYVVLGGGVAEFLIVCICGRCGIHLGRHGETQALPVGAACVGVAGGSAQPGGRGRKAIAGPFGTFDDLVTAPAIEGKSLEEIVNDIPNGFYEGW